MNRLNAKITLLHLVLTLATLALGAEQTYAWDDTGHQVMAAIAWSQMNQATQQKVQQLFPDDLKAERPVIFFRAQRPPTPNDPFPRITYNHVTIANWLDDVRDDSYAQPLAAWHYLNRPFFDGVEPKLAVPGSPNVREKVIELLGTLKKVRHFDPTGKDHPEDKTTAAYALAGLFHLVGDLHQPLHCINRFSPGFEEGDGGGGGFLLHFPQAIKLHTYWDAAGGLFDFVKLGRDYDDGQQRQLADFTTRVLKRWDPTQHPEWKNYSPDDWVEESFQLARTKTYTGITLNGVPDAAYTEKTQQICAERIGTAGYRLAMALNQIFEK